MLAYGLTNTTYLFRICADFWSKEVRVVGLIWFLIQHECMHHWRDWRLLLNECIFYKYVVRDYWIRYIMSPDQIIGSKFTDSILLRLFVIILDLNLEI